MEWNLPYSWDPSASFLAAIYENFIFPLIKYAAYLARWIAVLSKFRFRIVITEYVRPSACRLRVQILRKVSTKEHVENDTRGHLQATSARVERQNAVDVCRLSYWFPVWMLQIVGTFSQWIWPNGWLWCLDNQLNPIFLSAWKGSLYHFLFDTRENPQFRAQVCSIIYFFSGFPFLSNRLTHEPSWLTFS